MNDKDILKYSTGIYVNKELWEKISHKHVMYAVKLSSGAVINKLFIRDDGLIIGKAVGGRQEYDFRGFDFTSNDIVAIKVSQGFLTPFVPWIKI